MTTTAKDARKGKGFSRSAKQWEHSITDHIGKYVDRADWLKLAAIGVGTFSLHELGKAYYEQHGERTLAASAFGLIGIGLEQLVRRVAPPEPKKFPKEGEIPLWLMSFFSSYIIVEHGPEALSLLKLAV